MTQRTNYETPETTRLFLAHIAMALMIKEWGLVEKGFTYESVDGTIWAKNVEIKDFVKTLDDNEGIKIISFFDGAYKLEINIKQDDSNSDYRIKPCIGCLDYDGMEGFCDSVMLEWALRYCGANYKLPTEI